jgi:ribosomal protein S18 acetylase RimI-like enzyme
LSDRADADLLRDVRAAPTPELHRLSPGDVPRGAAVLARAFHEYPTFRRLLPDAGTRARRLEGVMRFFLGCGLLRGQVLAPSSALEGIAVWFRASDLGFGLGDLVRSGLLGALLGLGPAAARRFVRLGDAKREHRGRLLDGSEWFLDLIGVDPVLARRGFARRLVAPRLAQADGEGRACFLETSDPGNLGIYARFGFEVVSSYRHDDVESFCLRRPAAKVNDQARPLQVVRTPGR